VALEVIFVGGGVIGLSGAWRCAQEGRSVAVVDPAPGRGASWVAAGMLAPVTEAHFGENDLVSLLVAGAARWESFASELTAASDLDVGYRRCGTVVVAADASDRAAVDELLELQASLGLTSRRLSPSACRALVPTLAPGIRGGAEVPGDHQVDNRRLIQALLVACRRAGVTMIDDRVDEVLAGSGDAVSGVALAGGSELRAPVVVASAGAATSGLGGVAPQVLPLVRPVNGVVLRLSAPRRGAALTRTVRGLVHARPCYLVPRQDGSLVIGATTEELGFDGIVRAGAVHGLLDDARCLVPGIDELELVEFMAGLRPGSFDNAPFVGWTEMPGLAVATGHYRNGILLAPITAEGVAALVGGRAMPEELSRFGMRRADEDLGALQ